VSERNVAIVTGGASGIGAEICRQMLAKDYEVISLALKRPDWSAKHLHALTVDLTDRKATAEIAADIASRFEVTHLVHNAGAIRPALLPDVKVEDLDALTQLHLGAALLLAQATLPAMKSRSFGRIVLISSRGALGLQTRSAYAATKAGVIGLGRTWALELAPHGITVNMIAPGPIGGTDMFHAIVPAGSEREAALAKAIPVGRVGTPADVANAVMFFAARESSFVTGQVLYVCGGASIGTLVV
jgi:NAD(P)-dependent dehydrogenase (short-subunit alcohol dehydrogenase family)